MSTEVKFRCQNCNCSIVADTEAAGLSFPCFKCSEMVTIPSTASLARIDDRLPSVSYPNDLDEVMVASHSNHHHLPSGITPVELRMPGQLGGLKVNVDQTTSNAMASAFLGGLLVAVGAALAAFFGSKFKA